MLKLIEYRAKLEICKLLLSEYKLYAKLTY